MNSLVSYGMTQYKSFAGNYFHPALDPVVISYSEERQELGFSFGIYGQGLLCYTSLESDRNAFHIFFTNKDSQMFSLNTPEFTIPAGSNVTFHMDNQGRPDMLTMFFYDPVYPDNFYRKDVFDSLYTADERSNSGSRCFYSDCVYRCL